jgi:hypothetical protein
MTLALMNKGISHMLNIKLDHQSAQVPIGLDPATVLLPPHLGSYTRALLVSQDRRHLFVTPCGYPTLAKRNQDLQNPPPNAFQGKCMS